MPWNALSFKRVKWYHMHIVLVVVVGCIVALLLFVVVSLHSRRHRLSCCCVVVDWMNLIMTLSMKYIEI